EARADRTVRNVRGHQVFRRAEPDDLPANGREESAKRVTDRGIVLDDEDDRFGRRLRRAVSHGIVGPPYRHQATNLPVVQERSRLTGFPMGWPRNPLAGRRTGPFSTAGAMSWAQREC